MYYFDNSATTLPLPEVLEVFNKVSREYFANPSSVHILGEKSQKLLISARQQVANLLNFETSDIYFTSSGTEANNWVFRAILPELKKLFPDKNRVLILSIEHSATLKQIPMLEEQGYDIELIPVTDQGCINLVSFEKMLTEDVLLVSTMAVNNEVGAVQPLAEIADLLKGFPQVVWHVDAVQAITSAFDHILNDRIDLLSLSGHKFHAGRGVGILGKRLRVPSQTFLFGGGQEKGLRASTENLAGIVASSKALRLARDHYDQELGKLQTFRQQIMETLLECGWHVFAKENGAAHIVCAALAGYPGEVLLHAFEGHEVMVSTTSACSSRKKSSHSTLKSMGIDQDLAQSAVRISMSYLNTQAEVDYLCQTIETITNAFKEGSR